MRVSKDKISIRYSRGCQKWVAVRRNAIFWWGESWYSLVEQLNVMHEERRLGLR